MTCKVNADTTNGLKLTSDTSGEIDLQTNGTTKVHMDSSGNVGIGTSSPSDKLTVKGGASALEIALGIEASVNTSTQGGIGGAAGGNIGIMGYNNILFGTDGGSGYSERMRITSEGQMRFGTTGELNNSFVCIEADGTNPNGVEIRTDANNNAISFYSNSTTYAGAITLSGASTSYTSASDYRLKENVSYTWDATTRLKQLKPCRFNWIADDTDTATDGFLAHEVSTVVPDAVKGEQDATRTQNIYDDEGNITGTETVPDYQGIDQSKLVPLLVKTIQELEARITALENN